MKIAIVGSTNYDSMEYHLSFYEQIGSNSTNNLEILAQNELIIDNKYISLSRYTAHWIMSFKYARLLQILVI